MKKAELTRQKFEEIVVEVLERLPKRFKSRLQNVDVVIKDGSGRGKTLGLYEGVPLKDRTHDYGNVLPDKITLYWRNIETECREAGTDIREEVRHTIEHEIAHHFGITDEHLEDSGIY